MKFEEEDESKELDALNKEIENNLKFETVIYKNIDDSEKSLTKRDFKILLDMTYHFKQNIERVWNIIKEYQLFVLLNDSQHYPCIIKKGNNTYTTGNIFEGKLLSLYTFYAKVVKEKNFPDKKKIVRIFYLENGEIFKLTIILYKVTSDDSCVLNWVSKYVPKLGENITFQIKSRINLKELCKKIDSILQKLPIDLYQYESGIIPGKMEDIWNILIDNSKLASIAPNNKCFVPININNVKVGEIVNLPMKIKGIEGAVEIQLDLKEEKKGWNKWIFAYSILGAQPFKVPKQSVFVQLTKINKAETQLSVFTKINDPVSNELFKLLSSKKKYVIHSLKDYFENFY